MCPGDLDYATRFRIKSEGPVTDNTGMNGIEMECVISTLEAHPVTKINIVITVVAGAPQALLSGAMSASGALGVNGQQVVSRDLQGPGRRFSHPRFDLPTAFSLSCR